jgi:MFS family permease
MSTTAEVLEQPPVEPEGGFRSYLRVVRTPGMPAWTSIVLCQRLPVAMSPLALVYLGHLAAHSYAVGAVLAGANAFAEALTASVMGRRFDRKPARTEIRLVLGIQAILLLALAIPALVDPGTLPIWSMVLLASGAGAISSGAHGGLRALLVRTVDPSAHHAALSLESSLTTLVWAVGPAVVGLVALFIGEAWPLVVCAAIALHGMLIAGELHDAGPALTGDEAPERVKIFRLSWPAAFQEGAVLVCVGAAYTGLPQLLDSLGTDGEVAGPVLAAFAAAGMIGGLIYGSRKWSGAYRNQTTVLVMAVVVLVGLAVVMPNAILVIALLILSGLAGTPALVARAAGLQELLPESAWAAGFSSLYAAGGVGFGAAGLIVAGLLESVGIRTALIACVALAGAAALIGAIGEDVLAEDKARSLET